MTPVVSTTLVALLSLLERASADCANNFGDCTASQCCNGDGFGCFRRPTRGYAQCRPIPDGVCKDDNDWLCPGWELCGARFEACHGTRCCQSKDDRCYAKTVGYAQCMPVDTCVDKVGTDGVHWQCNELVPVEACSLKWNECTASRCCVDAGYSCFSVNDRYAQCMNRCEPDDQMSCAPHDKNVALSGASQAAVAAPPPPQLCSGPQEECTHSRCCAREGFTCYQRGEHFAQCLQTDTCRERWPDASTATCAELQPDEECGAFPGSDCTFSACCDGDDLKCFMKDWSLSRCMRGCSPADEGWSCTVRDRNAVEEPPPPPPPTYHETKFLRCADLATKHSVKRRSCADVPLDACGDSYSLDTDGVYTPCTAWRDECASGSPLRCDCELKGKDCPVAAAAARPTSAAAAGGAGGEAVGFGAVEMVTVVLSMLIILGGCAAGAWFCCLRQTEDDAMDDDVELDGVDEPQTTKTRGAKNGKHAKVRGSRTRCPARPHTHIHPRVRRWPRPLPPCPPMAPAARGRGGRRRHRGPVSAPVVNAQRAPFTSPQARDGGGGGGGGSTTKAAKGWDDGSMDL